MCLNSFVTLISVGSLNSKKWEGRALEMYSSPVMLKKKKSLNSLCKPLLGIVMWKKPIFVSNIIQLTLLLCWFHPPECCAEWAHFFVKSLFWLEFKSSLYVRKLFSMLHRVAGRVINANVVDCSHNLDTDQDYNYCTIFKKKKRNRKRRRSSMSWKQLVGEEQQRQQL